MPIPSSNPITAEGVELGRRLFYDELLSEDFSMSCSSCHLPVGSFTDNEAVSKGIDGIAGKRSSMSLLNIGYADNGLFWDGRSTTLEEQALVPVEDPIELHTSWPTVVERVKQHQTYPELFRKAFGIKDRDEISKELVAKALAQFQRTLVSSGNAKYDRWIRNEAEFTDEEFLGYVLFFDLDPNVKDAECGHCHNAPLFNTDDYFNNGIEPIENLSDFPDRGRAEVTGDEFDAGRFRAPTLRNITLTGPYMHDGRFQTLEEVVDHYNSGGHFQANKDPLIRPLQLLNHEKEALISFIHTLTDSTFIETPQFQDPN
ncbi:MAG: hypothetical protein HKN87_00055 [Saprospiraceae bacterium]|nr:hypothetical protein [Saprospiraceae bacterium]